MLQSGKNFIKKFLHSSKNEKPDIKPQPEKDFPETYLKKTDHLILGIKEQEPRFVSKKLNTILSQHKLSIKDLEVNQDFLIISNQIYFKSLLFSLESIDFFCLLPLISDTQIPYIVIDSNKNIISYSHLLNEFLEPQTKTISEALTSESWLKLQDQQNQLPELVFKKNQDITFVTSHSTTIGSFSCLYLFNITRYKSLEMHMAHSQKMQAVGQLAGGISHDFNNLLTAILGFCDLLLMKHPAGDPSFAEIMQIKQNSNRAANLVRQLLALSRKQVLKPKILDLSETIAELANLIRRLIGENIELDIIYGNNLKPIKVDQGQLEQVIINLVVNARDAIFKYKTGKGKITLSTKNVVIKSESDIDKKFKSPEGEKILPGEYVVISVIDNGIGIPQNIINKIFEPFFSTKALGAGTGLGLSTVYSILKQAGGMIYLASQENHGTIFDIYLKAEQTNIVEKEETNMELSLVTKDLTGNATILLVEDEIPVRMFCTHALTNKGHKIIEATSGEEALEIFNKNKEKIDLIISDVIMPGITGPALIAEIRKTNPNVKVIFMSGYAEEAFSKENDLQDFHFLSKPFTLNQLAKTVKDVLSLESV